MSKHFSIFKTDSQYQSAKDTLDFPHVSLIDTTGDLHYATYTGQEVANAPFGSILMAEVATNKLFYIEYSTDYNLTDYPLADFEPIAVCIFDKESNANNQTVFMAVQWADYAHLGIPQASAVNMSWGFNNVDLSSKVLGIRDEGTNHISSIYINNAVKPLITKDYSGSSITDTYSDGESTAFCSAWRFKTLGTQEGDWYFPSYYDISKYKNNYATINNILTNIKNNVGNSYLNTINNRLWCALEINNTRVRYLSTNSGWDYSDKSQQKYNAVRPVFIPHVEEL